VLADEQPISKAESYWRGDSWKQAAREYHEARGGRSFIVETDSGKLQRLRSLLQPDASLERVWNNLNQRDRAAVTVVEALAYQLRDGVKALRDPSAQRRISKMSEQQMLAAAARLTKEQWGRHGTRRVPPWQPNEIASFIKIWKQPR
jgi:hypothetical protein